MNDDNANIWIGTGGFFLVTLLVIGLPYGTYRYGRFAERRALYEALTQSLKDAYYDGWGDGYKAGMKDVKCPKCEVIEDEDNGRY